MYKLGVHLYEIFLVSLHSEWKAPYGMAFDTFTNNVQLAENFETDSSEVVGYGFAA